MDGHKNARLTHVCRIEMVQGITERGLSVPQASAAHGVSAPTAPKWLGRYLTMHADERTPSAVQFLRDAVAYSVGLGVRVRRLLTDNGSAFQSGDFATACKELGVRHRFTRPYRPQKAERFIRSALREWSYGFTYQHSSERRRAIAGTTTTTGIALIKASVAPFPGPDSTRQETTS